MPDYSIPTSETAGSMSLQQLLPGIDLSQYDMSEFQDVIPEFSTALLEMTQAAGAPKYISEYKWFSESVNAVPNYEPSHWSWWLCWWWRWRNRINRV